MVYEVGFWSDGEEVGFLNALKMLSPGGRCAGKLRLERFGGVFGSRQRHRFRRLPFGKRG
jgi:hypothetical protein